jgi:opacity protein-like surface antigen
MRFTSYAVALAVTALASSAAADSNLVSAGLAYGTEIHRPGGHISLYHAFRNETDAEYTTFRFGLDADAFFPRSGDFADGSSKATWWDLNGNGHWLFLESDDWPFAMYMLIGMNLARVSTTFTFDPGAEPTDAEQDTHKWKLGGNIGGGMEYRFGPVALFFEGKYVISSANQGVGVFGVRFTMPKKNRVDKL